MLLQQGSTEYAVVASGGVLLCFQWIQYGDDLFLVLCFLVIYLIYLFALFCLQESICENSVEKHLNWSLRSNADHGLWCILLMPLSLYTGCHRLSLYCSSTYKVMTVLATNTLLFSFGVLCICFIKCKPLTSSHSTKITLACYIVSFCLCTVVLSSQKIVGILWCAVISLFSTSVFYTCTFTIPKLFPKSFTFGEMLMTSQAIMLFISATVMNCANKIGLHCFYKTAGIQTQESSVLQAALLSCGAIFLLLFTIPLLRSTVGFYLCLTGIVLYMTLPWLCGVLGKNPFIWFYKYIFESENKIALICLWLVVVAMTICFVIVQKIGFTKPKISTTVNRKFFHIMIIMTYIPGFLWDPDLLYLASGLVLCLFLVLECIRILKVEPFGPVLQTMFSFFTDEKDEGLLILSHIDLLIGCSLPLWIFPGRTDSETYLVWFSGLIAIGVGDMAASVGGHWFGKHSWPGSRKTLEGTACALFSQILITKILIILGVPFHGNWIPLSIGFLLTSLLEAATTQIDNIILPFFLYQFI